MKKALGKGIESLIPSQGADEGLKYVKVNRIIPNEYQMREDFDQQRIDELAESIDKNGVVQPVLVTRRGKKYMLVAGERRWRAARQAGIEAIPCVEKDLKEQDALMLSLIENVQREDLSPLEEASAYKELSDNFSLTQKQIAERVGKSRSAVANALRILTLPEDLKKLVGSKKLSAGHARALLRVNDIKKRKRLALKIIREKLTVREAERLATSSGKSKRKSKKIPRNRTALGPEVKKLRDRFEKALGTKVGIDLKHKGSKTAGAIKIEFYSLDDFERIADIICEK